MPLLVGTSGWQYPHWRGALYPPGVPQRLWLEHYASVYAISAGADLLGCAIGEVWSGVVADPANRTHIEIDVAVLAPNEHGRPRRVLSLGEAKWDTVLGSAHLARLRRARDLLAVKGFDTQATVLACYSGAGFSSDLLATRNTGLALIDLDQIYRRP